MRCQNDPPLLLGCGVWASRYLSPRYPRILARKADFLSKQSIIPSISTDKFQASERGLVIRGKVDYETWYAYGAGLRRIESALQWVIGDWLNYGDKTYGETYAQAVDESQAKTWQNYKWVSASVETSLRGEVSWTHHKAIASLDPADQKRLLDEAVAKDLSVRELKELVRQAKRPQLSPNGHHSNVTKLYQGDMCDIVPRLGLFDLVIADPPYNVTDWNWDEIGDDDKFLEQTDEWLRVIRSALNEKYHLFWFCSPRYSGRIELNMRALNLPIKSRIVWHRRNMALGSAATDKFIDSWEMILHCGNTPLNFPAEWSEAWFDVQTFAVPQTNFTDTKLHPTQKPIELIARLIEFGSYSGGRVLDPFAGSGTTGAACQQAVGRECVLVEREAEYCQVASQRTGVAICQA